MKRIDLTGKTKHDLEAMGCRQWDEGGLMLLPPSVFRQLRTGVELTCIDGKKATVGRDEIDQDTRYGLLAWGVFPA